MKNEITKKQETQVATKMSDMPEFQPLDQNEVMKIPRLIMVQGNRQEIKEGLARPGDMINSLTKEVYGKKIELVALYQRPSTRIRWQSRDSGGGMLCISRNKSKPYGDPGDQYESCANCRHFTDTNPDTGCTSNLEIVSMVINGTDINLWEPILVSAESTRPSDAGFRDILNNARYHAMRSNGSRMFHRSYLINVIEAKNKFGEFFKTTCVPGNNNGLLPLDTIAVLEAKMKFFASANIDTSEQADKKGEWVD